MDPAPASRSSCQVTRSTTYQPGEQQPMPSTKTLSSVVLEQESQQFVDATAAPPFLYELTAAEARKVLDDVQATPIAKPEVEDRWITVAADVGDVRARIVRPPDTAGLLPVILY